MLARIAGCALCKNMINGIGPQIYTGKIRQGMRVSFYLRILVEIDDFFRAPFDFYIIYGSPVNSRSVDDDS